jgi:thiol-disulfide isomerase/thioredoxin
MPQILDALYKDFIKPYPARFTILLVVFLIVLFSVASYYAYKRFYVPKSDTDKLGLNVSNANARGKDANVMFFYADWCPHCKNAKPIIEDAKSNYTDTLVNGYKVVFVEVNCSDDNDPQVQSFIKSYNIQGSPTVKLVYTKNDGTKMTVDFDAKISKSSLDQFITTVLNTN